jgi:4-diphosphocytidyl-2-C-methyl-D-erythritol kinase
VNRTIRLAAPAKVNLFLEILGRRPDGYHTLSTLFQEISLADELRVSTGGPPAPACRLRCRGEELPTDSRNLVVRAVEAFSRRFGAGPAYDVSLTKRIPVGAGLGGGSSDAAAALKACWALRNGNPPRRFPWKTFVPLASGLGADVPFFLKGGLAEAGGIGDRLRPLPGLRIPLWLVLIFPRISVSTKWVYSRLRFPLTKRRSLSRLKSELARGSPLRAWAGLLFNRLEEVVLPRVPEVRRAKEALLRAGCPAALMSGSGSAVFGLAPSEKEGKQIVRMLASRPWDVWLTRGGNKAEGPSRF